MSVLEKFQTVLLLGAVAAGLLIGQVGGTAWAERFIVPFLLLMLYGVFLVIPLGQMRAAFANRRFLRASVMLNFIWTPLLAWGLGALFLSHEPMIWIGFLLLMVTPCTDWYLMFTAMAKGNVPLSASLLPVNFILQLVLLPVYLFLFAGTIATVPLAVVAESVLLVLVAPLVLAWGTRRVLRDRQDVMKKWVVPVFSGGQPVFLALAIMAMFASYGGELIQNSGVIALLLVPMLLFFILNFVVAQTAGRLLSFRYEDTVSLSLTIIARNSPVALAIAVTAFPNEPLIALALVIGPLIELPVLALVTRVLLRWGRGRGI